MPHAKSIHRWYNRSEWQRRRRHQLKIEPLCLEHGHVTPATVADHVQSHQGDYTAFRLGPLHSLCAECHKCARWCQQTTRLSPRRWHADRSAPSVEL